MKTYNYLFIILINIISSATVLGSFDYSEEQFKKELYSAYKADETKTIWKYGLGSTILLVATREATIIPIQDEISGSKPLGESSQYGDLMGQLIPNFTYFAYQKWSQHSDRRANFMLKTSMYSGITTFFLKRLINERRPSGDDRNSMPSGHTTTAFAFAGVVGIEHPEWAIPAYTLASFVAVSRINDNAHYIHNITMGATIGLAYAYGLKSVEVKEKVSLLSYPVGSDGLALNAVMKF